MWVHAIDDDVAAAAKGMQPHCYHFPDVAPQGF